MGRTPEHEGRPRVPEAELGRLVALELEQQRQVPAAGSAVYCMARARLPLAVEALERGELVEPFRCLPGSRLATPYAYWLVASNSAPATAEVQQFCAWIAEEAQLTRRAIEARIVG